MDNIQPVIDQNLCIACGFCVAVCPKSAVSLIQNTDKTIAKLDPSVCVKCKVCSTVCPYNDFLINISDFSIRRNILGEYRSIICAQSKNENILLHSTSGGVISTLVTKLINDNQYDAATLVGDFKGGIAYSEIVSSVDDVTKYSKSKYVTVSYENIIRYILEHRNKRIIFIGTGCSVNALLNTIRKKNLNRDNFLIIGLFCDKTMYSSVYEYFGNHPLCNGKTLNSIDFRSKDAGGWPGNLMLHFNDNTAIELDISERGKIKDYYMPERCLYCLNKLNINCDISVGDNYIPQNADKKGVSSVIIRTEIGSNVWNMYNQYFSAHADDEDFLLLSQHISAKKNNYYFARFKGLYGLESSENSKCDETYEYSVRLHKLHLNKGGNVYSLIDKDVKRLRRKNLVRRGIKKLKMFFCGRY